MLVASEIVISNILLQLLSQLTRCAANVPDVIELGVHVLHGHDRREVGEPLGRKGEGFWKSVPWAHGACLSDFQLFQRVAPTPGSGAVAVALQWHTFGGYWDHVLDVGNVL